MMMIVDDDDDNKDCVFVCYMLSGRFIMLTGSLMGELSVHSF